MNGKCWGAVKKEIVRMSGVAIKSICDLIEGIAGFLSDNGKEMCVAADIAFIPISCTYLLGSDYYRNNTVDKVFLIIILLVNVFFTSFVFYAVAKGKKSDYATWPAGLSVLWGIFRILWINHGYRIHFWVDILALAVCVLTIPALVIRNVNKRFKNGDSVEKTEHNEYS